MRVVIIGARSRSELSDNQLVNEILDDVLERYSKLVIVTKSCDRGVGKIIRNRCKSVNAPKVAAFDMIELNMRHYLMRELPKSEFLGDYNALNAALIEIGDVFHLLVEEESKPGSNMYDLIQRVREEGRPIAVYKPSESKNGPKVPIFGNMTIGEPILNHQKT